MGNVFLGINGKANEVNSIFIGDSNNKAQQVLDLYYGIENKAIQIPLSNSILPKEYQQVEYIQTAGQRTTYIETSIPASTPIQIITEITLLEGGGVLIGAYKSQSPSLRIIPIRFEGSSPAAYGFAYDINNYSSSNRLEINKKCKIESIMKVGTQKLISDGVTVLSKSSTTSINYTTKMHIFATNYFNGSNTTITSYINCKLYSMKIYKSEDKSNLVANFYPCYEKSTNIVGLYNLVENKFYKSKVGNFISGPEYEEELLSND